MPRPWVFGHALFWKRQPGTAGSERKGQPRPLVPSSSLGWYTVRGRAGEAFALSLPFSRTIIPHSQPSIRSASGTLGGQFLRDRGRPSRRPQAPWAFPSATHLNGRKQAVTPELTKQFRVRNVIHILSVIISD